MLENVSLENEMPDIDFPVLEFTKNDRCDRCGAEAYTIAIHDDQPSELLFCLHHRREYKDSLRQDGWTLIDNEEAIAALAHNKLIDVPA